MFPEDLRWPIAGPINRAVEWLVANHGDEPIDEEIEIEVEGYDAPGAGDDFFTFVN